MFLREAVMIASLNWTKLIVGKALFTVIKKIILIILRSHLALKCILFYF